MWLAQPTVCTCFFRTHYKIYKTSCFHLLHFFYLFWFIFILNFLIATGPDAEYILRSRQRLHKYFVILHSCRYPSPVPPAVGNKQEDGIGNSGLQLTARVRLSQHCVFRCGARTCTANWQTEMSHMLHFIFLENLVGAAVRSQSGRRPTEGWTSSRTGRARKFRPLFGALCSHGPELWEVAATAHNLVVQTTGQKVLHNIARRS